MKHYVDKLKLFRILFGLYLLFVTFNSRIPRIPLVFQPNKYHDSIFQFFIFDQTLGYVLIAIEIVLILLFIGNKHMKVISPLLFIVHSYVLFGDYARYSNHSYLESLMIAIFALFYHRKSLCKKMLQFQVCIILVFSVLHKMFTPQFVDGSFMKARLLMDPDFSWFLTYFVPSEKYIDIAQYAYDLSLLDDGLRAMVAYPEITSLTVMAIVLTIIATAGEVAFLMLLTYKPTRTLGAILVSGFAFLVILMIGEKEFGILLIVSSVLFIRSHHLEMLRKTLSRAILSQNIFKT